MEQLIRLLADEGELFVQTDVPDRAEEYQKRLDSFEDLQPAGDEDGSAILVDNPYGAMSNRERRAVWVVSR